MTMPPLPPLNLSGGNQGDTFSRNTNGGTFKSGNVYNKPPDFKWPALILAAAVLAYAYIKR